MANVRRWVWAFIALGAALTIALIAIAASFPLRSETLKDQIVAALAQRLNGDVALGDLSVRFFPRVHAEGKGLLIRHRDQSESVPPLIAIERFTIDADMLGVVRKRVAHVQLNGLVISIPPDDGSSHVKETADPAPPHRLHTDGQPVPAGVATDSNPHIDPATLEAGVTIDTLESDNARLVIIPKQTGKAAKVWAIHRLHMRNVGILEVMPFQATLTNGVPPGEIVTAGKFGPWNAKKPGATPLEGTFTFDKADLGVFNGIAGTLSSRGSFGGALNYIDVNGETDTPDFVIKVGGHPFPLHTKYHTIVDGTNGDTVLERIDGQFLESALIARGSVLDGPPGEKGRTVTLDITMTKARIEDVMRMAVNTPKPPMTGALQLTTKFLLPPGETDVVDRLRLNGRFSITAAKFTNYDVQGKIVELSHRGRGRKEDQRKEQVASNFTGRFILGNGRLELPEVSFGVPGAQVKLAGGYGLKAETLAFKGDLLMDAKVSETVSGVKSLLLKLADPFFRRKGGGSSIPIKIEGTRNDPQFGLDMRRVFKRGN